MLRSTTLGKTVYTILSLVCTGWPQLVWAGWSRGCMFLGHTYCTELPIQMTVCISIGICTCLHICINHFELHVQITLGRCPMSHYAISTKIPYLLSKLFRLHCEPLTYSLIPEPPESLILRTVTKYSTHFLVTSLFKRIILSESFQTTVNSWV